MNKAHSGTTWENYPSDKSPLNEANLNKLENSVDIIDDRVITLDTTKATKMEVATLVADVTFEESTGIITITKKNGSKITIDTQMEKIAINFDYNTTTQQIILTLIDGTQQYIDLSALITQYEFLDTDTVTFTVGTDGKVSASVKEGSIEEKYLEPNYLAKIKVEVAKAETSRADAAASATKAESYAMGGTGSREGEDSDNAKYYYKQVKDVSEAVKGGLQPRGTVAFADLPQLADCVVGWMFNISDEFTTTDDFKEGAGNTVPAGANIYKTSDGKWDVLAGTPVTGIKGAKEDSFRRGNVEITAENVGAVAVGGDTEENTVTFNAASERKNLASGEAHTTLFGKIAKWFADLKEVAFTGKISWADVTGKPSAYTPSSHTHDDRYYKKEESDTAAAATIESLIRRDEKVKEEVITGYSDADAALDNKLTAVINELKKFLPLSGGTLTGNLKLTNAKWIDTLTTSGAPIHIIGMNNSNNIHMGDYTGDNISPVYLHAKGKQYNFTDDGFCANVTNNVPLGLAGKLWKTVYAKTGTINTSDRNKKHDIKDLTEVYEKLFLMLQPKSFVFNDGDRVHIGAISQDVEEIMMELGIEPKQFAGFCKDIRYEYTEFSEEDGMPIESSKVPCKDEDGNIIYDYALRYQEFIFLTVHMVQKLWKRIDAVEKENAEMKEQIRSMQQDIEELKKVRA